MHSVKSIFCASMLIIAWSWNMSYADENIKPSTQIGKAFHEAYKLSASAPEYAYMSSRAMSAHNEGSFESILIKCADIALQKEEYSSADISATLALAASLKANDQKLFEENADVNAIPAAMQLHADILNCAMP
jgi:hypothetical protein